MKNRKVYVTTFCGVAVAMNIVLGIITSALGIPLYLDTLGTVLSAAILGPVPGIIVGALSNIITGLIYSVSDIPFCLVNMAVGLIVGLVAHKIAKINESTDKKYVFKWSVIASIAGLAFNVIADPIVGYFYKQYILGQPQKLAEALAKMSAAATFVNAVVSVILVAIIYNAVRPVLIKSHLLTVTKKKEQTA